MRALLLETAPGLWLQHRPHTLWYIASTQPTNIMHSLVHHTTSTAILPPDDLRSGTHMHDVWRTYVFWTLVAIEPCVYKAFQQSIQTWMRGHATSWNTIICFHLVFYPHSAFLSDWLSIRAHLVCCISRFSVISEVLPLFTLSTGFSTSWSV